GQRRPGAFPRELRAVDEVHTGRMPIHYRAQTCQLTRNRKSVNNNFSTLYDFGLYFECL
ncbi:Uncharacterized protein DAT39_012210, partial [Clarias magur]